MSEEEPGVPLRNSVQTEEVLDKDVFVGFFSVFLFLAVLFNIVLLVLIICPLNRHYGLWPFHKLLPCRRRTLLVQHKSPKHVILSAMCVSQLLTALLHHSLVLHMYNSREGFLPPPVDCPTIVLTELAAYVFPALTRLLMAAVLVSEAQKRTSSDDVKCVATALVLIAFSVMYVFGILLPVFFFLYLDYAMEPCYPGKSILRYTSNASDGKSLSVMSYIVPVVVIVISLVALIITHNGRRSSASSSSAATASSVSSTASYATSLPGQNSPDVNRYHHQGHSKDFSSPGRKDTIPSVSASHLDQLQHHSGDDMRSRHNTAKLSLDSDKYVSVKMLPFPRDSLAAAVLVTALEFVFCVRQFAYWDQVDERLMTRPQWIQLWAADRFLSLLSLSLVPCCWFFDPYIRQVFRCQSSNAKTTSAPSLVTDRTGTETERVSMSRNRMESYRTDAGGVSHNDPREDRASSGHVALTETWERRRVERRSSDMKDRERVKQFAMGDGRGLRELQQLGVGDWDRGGEGRSHYLGHPDSRWDADHQHTLHDSFRYHGGRPRDRSAGDVSRIPNELSVSTLRQNQQQQQRQQYNNKNPYLLHTSSTTPLNHNETVHRRDDGYNRQSGDCGNISGAGYQATWRVSPADVRGQTDFTGQGDQRRQRRDSNPRDRHGGAFAPYRDSRRATGGRGAHDQEKRYASRAIVGLPPEEQRKGANNGYMGKEIPDTSFQPIQRTDGGRTHPYTGQQDQGNRYNPTDVRSSGRGRWEDNVTTDNSGWRLDEGRGSRQDVPARNGGGQAFSVDRRASESFPRTMPSNRDTSNARVTVDTPTSRGHYHQHQQKSFNSTQHRPLNDIADGRNYSHEVRFPHSSRNVQPGAGVEEKPYYTEHHHQSADAYFRTARRRSEGGRQAQQQQQHHHHHHHHHQQQQQQQQQVSLYGTSSAKTESFSGQRQQSQGWTDRDQTPLRPWNRQRGREQVDQRAHSQPCVTGSSGYNRFAGDRPRNGGELEMSRNINVQRRPPPESDC